MKGRATRGTLAVSWGPWGGLYVHRARLCLGWVALTYVPIELDDLMEGWTAHREARRDRLAEINGGSVFYTTTTADPPRRGDSR